MCQKAWRGWLPACTRVQHFLRWVFGRRCLVLLLFQNFKLVVVLLVAFAVVRPSHRLHQVTLVSDSSTATALTSSNVRTMSSLTLSNRTCCCFRANRRLLHCQIRPRRRFSDIHTIVGCVCPCVCRGHASCVGARLLGPSATSWGHCRWPSETPAPC